MRIISTSLLLIFMKGNNKIYFQTKFKTDIDRNSVLFDLIQMQFRWLWPMQAFMDGVKDNWFTKGVSKATKLKMFFVIQVIYLIAKIQGFS